MLYMSLIVIVMSLDNSRAVGVLYKPDKGPCVSAKFAFLQKSIRIIYANLLFYRIFIKYVFHYLLSICFNASVCSFYF